MTKHLNYCQYPEGHECTCKTMKSKPSGGRVNGHGSGDNTVGGGQ